MNPRQRRRRHIPQRTCVGCGETASKRSLIRLVRTEAGVVLDPTGKLPGRGAYVHDDPSCWEKALDRSLARALRMQIGDEAQAQLREALEAHKESRHHVG